MIEATNLSKNFGELEAVRGVCFNIAKGQVVGLLGPNGAGKTTTMRMLTTYLPPSEGTVTVAGFDVRTQAVEIRKRIGYLPEVPPLYPELRVDEYLSFAARIRDVPSGQLKARVSEVMERCGLVEVSRRICSQLSRGYRQRVGLAQALVHNPEVIILDEPTSGLDPAQIIEIRKLIAELKDEHTVILSTHILQEVSQVCSHAIIIAFGQIVAADSLDNLTEGNTLEERFLQAVATDSGLGEVDRNLEDRVDSMVSA